MRRIIYTAGELEMKKEQEIAFASYYTGELAVTKKRGHVCVVSYGRRACSEKKVMNDAAQ